MAALHWAMQGKLGLGLHCSGSERAGAARNIHEMRLKQKLEAEGSIFFTASGKRSTEAGRGSQ